jgi:hypothetical protein
MIDAIVCWFLDHEWLEPIVSEYNIYVMCNRCGCHCKISTSFVREKFGQRKVGFRTRAEKLSEEVFLCPFKERVEIIERAFTDVVQGRQK